MQKSEYSGRNGRKLAESFAVCSQLVGQGELGCRAASAAPRAVVWAPGMCLG